VTLDEYNTFCGSLPATSFVVQWGDANVWKVGGKVFALGRGDGDEPATITFKTTPLDFRALSEMPGLRPAPYLASRGLTWIQHFEPPGLSDEELREQIEDSHRLVAAGLSKKLQRELGLATSN
jgi:predicted DNA-binding protein (MmcQ/YjbR family)